jgi:hypothetical protein
MVIKFPFMQLFSVRARVNLKNHKIDSADDLSTKYHPRIPQVAALRLRLMADIKGVDWLKTSTN